MKIGLIAMSGVRVQNSALLKQGLTLPGFVERSKVIASLPSLALLTLAGLTPPDIKLSYLDVHSLDSVDGLPGEFDVVAIASYTARIKDAYKLAARYRRIGTLVILGGLNVTACPNEARQYADAIVLGEAETVWPRIICDLKLKNLQPVYDARRHSFDLAHAPMPAFELLNVERYKRLTVQTQRGCPLSCEFCASSIRIAPKFKVKPIEKVIAEIRRIKEICPNPFIELADDNTFANKSYGKRLVKAIAKEKIRWFTETDISVADDEDLLSMLRDSGCVQLLIGLEATDESTLDGIETKANWKAKRVSSYIGAIRRIQSYGITVNGCFILGLDGQDKDSFSNVKKFVEESGLYDVQVTVQTPFPGTPLYNRLKTANRLISPGAWESCTLFDVNYIPDKMSVAELEEQFHSLVGELYTEEFTRWRKFSFRKQLREVNKNNN